MKRVLMVASEGLPFIKSGGLADVIGSLPKALTKLGHDVRVVMPLYLKIAMKSHDQLELIREYSVNINYREVPVRLLQCNVDGVWYYFIEHQGYFEREKLYGYEDDGERFAFFQKAVLEMLNQLDFFPEIIHCHDWHTGMIPVMAKENFQHDWRYTGGKYVYTIHNLAFQGNFGKEMLEGCLGLSNYLYDCGNVKYDTGISFMKSGIVYADKVTTVSPTYAREITTTEYGEHLEHVLQQRGADLGGIVNGIDYEVWNPSTDEHVAYNYNKNTVFKQKAANKTHLQHALGLEENPDVMLIGVVSRLTVQKGFDLILDQMGEMVQMPIQLVILGSGDAHYEATLRDVENGNKGRICFYKGYNEELAHQIYASCDAFLMPSKFEPCGISQLISMHYGTLPIVRETGGLKDTVNPYNEFTGEGNGFSFAQYSGFDMKECIWRAIACYYDNKQAWKQLIKNAMNTDVSWEKSAHDYSDLYEYL